MNRRIYLVVLMGLILNLPIALAQQAKHAEIFAHRGGAAYFPESSIAAMRYALSIGVPVLELDVHVTADNKVVVWHDPFLSSTKVLNPDGTKLGRGSDMRHLIYKMNYADLVKYDIGSLEVKAFKDRVNEKAHISLLSDLIDYVEAYTTQHQIPSVSYDIEIKSNPMKDNRMTPPFQEYTDLVMDVLNKKNLGDRLIIQSFDPRTLNYLNAKYPKLTLAFLLESGKYPLKEVRKHLNFTPSILSPNYQLVNPVLISDCHEMGIRVVPWTVNRREDILFLNQMGVDGIITDYPADALMWLKK